jgi:ABC-type phosphate transport system substrate-binding protein
MSQTSSARPRRRRTARAAVLALAVSAVGALGIAPSAGADFTVPKCGGQSTNANGASFAKGAEEFFNSRFKNFFCAGSGLSVTYNANGSGAGIETAQLRTGTSRFWASDDPPTPAQVALMNSGAEKVGAEIKADANEGNNGKTHIFPIAAGAIAPLVNFPEGCDPEKLADKFRTVSAAAVTGNPALKGIVRVRLTKKLFEKVWAGEENVKWSQAFPELVGDADCDIAITRVVRFDKSGTTFGFKDYLRTINPGRGWTTTFEAGANGNREWPNAEFGKREDCPGEPNGPGAKPDNEDHLTSACANGNGELVKKVVATDGSIGYSDILTARNNSTTLAVNAALATAPTTAYWTQVQNGSVAVGSAQEEAGQGFTEPTLDEANGFKTTAAGSPGQKGANCVSPGIFKNTPATSFGDWSQTSGVNATTGFGICTLTYVMVPDDSAVVFGNSAEEEAKARTVKDYMENIVTEGSQAPLQEADYAPLPTPLLNLAKTAVAEIGWSKSGGGGGEIPPVDPPKNDPKGTPPSAPPPPSNAFTLLRKTISSKAGSATVSVKLPGAGTLEVLGTAKSGKKSIKAGRVVLTAGAAGTYNVTLKPTGAAKQLLAKTGSLKVALKLTFTPNGGTASTSNSSVTLKLTKKGKGA